MQKGQKTAKTKAWETIGEYLLNDGAERAKKIMLSSDNENFMKYYITLLEYFRPKQARTEMNIDCKENRQAPSQIIIIESNNKEFDEAYKSL